MKRLPLLISLPHAGLRIPEEVKYLNLLTKEEIANDGDEGAAVVYTRLSEYVERFVTTDVARAFVDLNRAEDDFSKDGVIKTHTCWDVPIYQEQPEPALIRILLSRYYFPYHQHLTDLAGSGPKLGVDCHTMAASGPPVGPDKGEKRPWICLGNNHHKSCPQEWVELMAECFHSPFHGSVTINRPFAGGWTTRFHGREMPWIQLELSRDHSISSNDKGEKVLTALEEFCRRMGWFNKKTD
jgi:formiminoglutamase